MVTKRVEEGASDNSRKLQNPARMAMLSGRGFGWFERGDRGTPCDVGGMAKNGRRGRTREEVLRSVSGKKKKGAWWYFGRGEREGEGGGRGAVGAIYREGCGKLRLQRGMG